MNNKFKKIIGYISPYKYYAIGNMVFNLLHVFFGLFSLTMIIPFLSILFSPTATFAKLAAKPAWGFSGKAIQANFEYVLGSFADGNKERALLFVCILVVSAFLLKNLFLFLSYFCLSPIRNGVVQDIRNKLYRKILDLPLSYYSDERKGNIISKMTNDVKEVESSVMSSIEVVFRDPIMIISYVATLVYMSPHLSLFVGVLLPVSGVLIGMIGKSLKKSSKSAQEKLGSLMSNLEETLSGLRIIKAFNAEKKMEQRFKFLNRSYTKGMNAMTRRNYLASPLSEFLGAATLVTVLFYGGNLVFKHESPLSPDAFVGYLVIFSQVLNPAKSLTNGLYNIQRGLASIDRINEILLAENKIDDNPNGLQPHSFDKAIEYKNVTFSYGKTEVLKNINLVVEKGKSIALVGQSGSGKSTMVDLLPRFWDIQSGSILIDGVPIKDMNIINLRALMGNVNQEPILFNETIYNNIAFGLENTKMEDVIAAAKVANAHDFIMETPEGYNTNIGDRGNKLSGGQRQRLSIARAVLKNPPILILDEATSSLDTESEKLVQEALTNLMKNRTSIIIAHRLSTIRNVDEICVMQNGEIVERGDHDSLIALNGVYKKLYELQSF